MKREEEAKRYQTFEDLDVYQVAREFRRKMYQAARRLPNFEKFALADQIRRAAVSLTNNVAEGHGRFHFLDQIKFMLQARGSLEELLDDLNVCEDEKYFPADEIASLRAEAWRVHQLINGYIRFLRTRLCGGSSRAHEIPMDEESIEDPGYEGDIRCNASSLQRFNE